MLSEEQIDTMIKARLGNVASGLKADATALVEDVIAALRAQADAGPGIYDANTLDAAITIVIEAREALGGGTQFPYDTQERSTIGPYLDGIEDKLRELYDVIAHPAPEAAQALSAHDREVISTAAQTLREYEYEGFAEYLESILTRSAANEKSQALSDSIIRLLREARATLEMWKDVAPAVSLCADIDKALARAATVAEPNKALDCKYTLDNKSSIRLCEECGSPEGRPCPLVEKADKAINGALQRYEQMQAAQRQAEPPTDDLEFRVRDAIQGIANCIADPMWSGHAEVSKANLKRWHKALHDLRAAKLGQQAEPTNAELAQAFAYLDERVIALEQAEPPHCYAFKTCSSPAICEKAGHCVNTFDGQQQAEPVGDELRDCPFCGSDEITIGSFGSSHLSPQHYVKCEQCDGAVCNHDSGADAIAAWNRRAAQSGQRAGVAEEQAWRDVMAERIRQMTHEGWTPGHDDAHAHGDMAKAAAAYALRAADPNVIGGPVFCWPWDAKWWRPTTPRRNLVKAGALILAEIERLDRAAAAQQEAAK